MSAGENGNWVPPRVCQPRDRGDHTGAGASPRFSGPVSLRERFTALEPIPIENLASRPSDSDSAMARTHPGMACWTRDRCPGTIVVEKDTPVGDTAELLHREFLDLPDAFLGDLKELAELVERMPRLPIQAEPQFEDCLLSGGQGPEDRAQELDRLTIVMVRLPNGREKVGQGVISSTWHGASSEILGPDGGEGLEGQREDRTFFGGTTSAKRSLFASEACGPWRVPAVEVVSGSIGPDTAARDGGCIAWRIHHPA